MRSLKKLTSLYVGLTTRCCGAPLKYPYVAPVSITTRSYAAVQPQPLSPQHDQVTLFTLKNGEKETNIFPESEFQSRIDGIRRHMAENDVGACVFTSLHNLVYFTGYLPYSFGRNYACVVTHDDVTNLAGAVDGGKPWRRAYGNSILYTDWTKDNFFRGVDYIVSNTSGKIGVEFDSVSIDNQAKYHAFLPNREIVDIAVPAMKMRMVKSPREIEVLKQGARIADIGGEAAVEALCEGITEYEVVLAVTDAMVREIARTYPQVDLMDTMAWLQSGVNTDGAHNPPTTKKIRAGEILSFNCFPMIQGYYTALERTFFVGHASDAHLRIWKDNVEVFKRAIDLIRPGAKISDIVLEINEMYREKNLLQYKAIGYGHSVGNMCHYYGRDQGLELREDNDTVLEPNMMFTMEPMFTIPEGTPGAGAYREHDILRVTEHGVENITKFPVGPEHNIIRK